MSFRAETRRRVADQTPAACALLVVMAALSGISEAVAFPERIRALAAFELFTAAGALTVYVWVRRRPSHCIPVLLIGVNLFGLALVAYHAHVGASAEACMLVVTALLCSAAVICHWGWRLQLLACIGAVVGYPLALFTRLSPALPAPTLLLFLACVVGLTAWGAHVIQNYLLRSFDLTEAVRARELRLRSYLDQALIGIGILSPRGTWRDANAELGRILGYERDELLTLSWRDVAAADGRPGDALEGLLDGTREAACGDWHLVGEGGRGVDALVSARAFRGTDGAVQDVVVMVQDITERKRAETRLARAKDEAELAYRSKSDFLAAMSHDLRTPMNIIFGMTEMALDVDTGGMQRDYLNTARRAALDLLVLVDEVLDLSRIEAGRLEIRRRPFAVREWLGETVEPLRVLAAGKGLELDWKAAFDVPDVATGDPNRLRQVVVNLVSNAVKYTEAGRITVHVEAQTGSAHAPALHFTVSDTGVGIPPTEQERIFEPYIQGETAREAPRGGAGLGLAICSRLVDLMGGRIWVESALGRGSRFHFTASLEPAD